MNKTFHSVWNASKQAWVAAAETVSAKGKPTSGVKVAAVISALFGGLLTLSAHAQNAPPANTLPTGAQVKAGQASISTTGANMVVQQSSSRAAINWQSFNVGSNAQVQFQQPDANSVTLNRVMSADPSQIFGRISANGQIVLTNPAGVYFAPSARVDVGALIATTHDISDTDFMAGKSRFERNASTGSVVNEGELKAALGGYIALLAPEVRNQGAIIAQMGTVAMASGEAVDLKFDSNNRLTSLRVDPSQIAALVDNRHAVQAPGGLVIISAQSMDRLVGGVVKNSGRIEATGMQSDGGRIVLSGSHKVSNSGTLDASSATAQGGSISLQSADIELNDGTRIDATGATGGGTVLVGGNWQGSADPLLTTTEQPTQAATTVTMASGATIDASATQQGPGGTVVLWSDVGNPASSTNAHGYIHASGGAAGGDGGQVETSGHTLNTDGIAVHAASNGGKNGLWLLDPAYTTIDAAAVTDFLTSLNAGTDVVNDASSISWTSGVNLLKNAGNDATLTLRAGVDLAIGDTISIESTWGALNLVLWSGYASSGSRGVTSIGSATITTNGGHVWVGGGASNETTTNWNGLTVGAGHATAFNAKTIGLKLNGTSINTNGGDIFLKGRSANAAGYGTQANNTTLDSGSGNVTLEAGSGTNIGISLEGSSTISGTGDLKFEVFNAYSTITKPIKTNGTLALNRGAGNVTFIADNFSASTFNLTTTGDLTVKPYLASFSSAFSLSSISLGGIPSSLTIGKPGNTAAITVDAATSVAGPISIYGGNITVSNNITETSATPSTLTLKATGNITLSASSNISSSNNKLNVVFWSDSDANGQGYIGLNLNSSVKTNGGDIVMGGGSEASGLPGGYAAGEGLLSGTTYYGLGLNTTTLDTTINNALDATAGNITLRGSGTYNSTTTGDISHGISLYSSQLYGNNLTLDGKTTSTSTTGLVTYGISSNGGAAPSNTQLNAYGDITLTGTAASPVNTRQNAIRWGTNHTMSSTNGNITVNAVGQIDWLSSQTLTIAQDKTLTINNSWSGNWSNVIAGGGGLIKLGTGTLTLSGINTYTGATTISAGTLTLNSTGTIADSSGIDNNGNFSISAAKIIDSMTGTGTTSLGSYTLTIGNASNTSATYGGIISGTGGITKAGTGTLTLSGLNTYTGATTISAGTLALDSTGTIATSSGVANSGNFSIGAAKTIDSMTGSGTTDLGSYTLTIGDASNTSATYGGIISGTGGITKAGTGTLTLSGINTYTGVTTISAGALALNSTGTIATSSGVANSGSLSIAADKTIDSMTGTGTTSLGSSTLTIGDASNTSATYGGIISGTGGITKAGTGTLTLSGVNTYTGATTISDGTLALNSTGTIANSSGIANSGSLSIAAAKTIDSMTGTGTTSLGSFTLTIGDASNTSATYGGIISGTGGITKAGTGTLTLSGINTYTGATTISAGTLALDSTGTIATSSGVANSGSFSIAADKTIDSMTGTGTTSLGSSTLTIGDASNTSATYGGIISGTGGITKDGSGTLTLSGVNTYTGPTTISAGTLKLSNAAALGTSVDGTTGTSSVTVNSDGSLDLNGLTVTRAADLTITGTGTYGALINSSATAASYAGLVALGGDATISAYGGNLTLSNTGSITGAYGLTLNAQSGKTGTLASVIDTGTGAVTKSGAGTWTLSGINTFTGATTISAGTLALDSTGTIATSSGVANSGSFTISANKTIDSMTGTGTTSLGSNTLTIGDASNTSASYGGIISGTGGITKAGTGTLTLSGVNTYTGGTTVNAGVLAIAGNLANNASATVTINDGGTLRFDDSDIFGNHLTNVVTPITIYSGGLLTNSGAFFSRLGPLTLSGGTLSSVDGLTVYGFASPFAWSIAAGLTANGNTQSTISGTGNVQLGSLNAGGGGSNSATFTVNDGAAAVDLEVSASLSNSGNSTATTAAYGGWGATVSSTLTKAGTGTLLFSGVNLYGGTTTVNAGTLAISASTGTNSTYSAYSGLASPGSATTVSSGATLDLRNATITKTGTITLNGSTLMTSTGTSSLSGPVALSGTSNSTIDVSGTKLTLSGVVSGSYGLSKTGTGTLTLSGINAYTGATTISTGTLALDSTGTIATSSGVANSGNLSIDANKTIDSMTGTGTTDLGSYTLTIGDTSNTSATYGGIISGSGGITKAGTGTLTLTGNNTYSGVTTVSAGTLKADHNNALGTTAGNTVVANGATLSVSDGVDIAKPLQISGTGASSLGALNLLGTNTYSGAITLSANSTITGGTGTQTLSGNVNGGFGLTVTSSGSWVQTGALGNSTALSSVSLRSSGSASLDAVTATGTIDLATLSGNLTLNNAISTTNATSSAIVLNAAKDTNALTSTGGDIIVNGGSLSVGAGGRATVYSGSLSGSTGLTSLIGSGSGRFRYGSDETTTNYTTALTSGLNAVFRERPTASVSSLVLSMTYGDALPTITGTGTVNADATSYSITSRVNATSGNIKASGTPYTITENLTGLGYLVNSSSTASTGTLTVATKALTMSGLSAAASKVYNGNTSATVSGTAALLSAQAVGSGTNTDGKRYTGDTVSITGTAVGTYNSKDVASASTVTFSGLSLTGADASNYSLTIQSPASATITAKALTMSGLTASASKVYDGTTTATVSGTATLLSSEAVGTGTTADGKPYTGDIVAISGTALGTYNSKDVATATTVTFSGLSLNNGNYSLTIQSPAAATITAKALTMSGLTVSASKVYDGTTAATVSGTAALLTDEAVGTGTTADGRPYTGDVVAITGTAIGTYNNKNVASATTVTFSGLSLNNSNYSLTVQSPASATITAKALTLSGLSSQDKVYDGTTTATISGTAALQTAIAAGTGTSSDGKAYSGDSITLSGTVAANFNSKDVASATQVAYTGLSLTGSSASNYTLTSHAVNTTARITPAPLTVTVNDDAKFVVETDRVGFNGVSYSGFVNGETSSVLGGSATITRSSALTNTTSGSYTGVLTATGLTSSNYTITYRPGNFTITPANELLVSVTNASTAYGTSAQYAINSVKYYNDPTNDGLDNGTVYILGSGGVAGSSVSINSSNLVTINDGAGGTATFTLAPNSGVFSQANKLSVGSYQLGVSGAVTANSANFSNTITVTGSHQVNTKGITASASSVSKAYDGTTSMSGVALSLSTVETNDVVSVNGAGAFANKNAGTGLNYTISNLVLSGTDASNYHLTGGSSFSGSNGVITAVPLTITANNASKTYDGVAYSGGNGVSYSGFVGGESVSALSGSLSYGGTSQGATNAGTGYTIVPSGLSSNNYTLSYVDGALTINPATVVVTAITGALQGTVSKVYDGTTTATLSAANYALTGWVGLDGASVTKTSGSYDSAAAGSGKTVTVSLSNADYTATGSTNLNNYTLPSSIGGAVGTISKAPLTVTASNASKTYDGVAYSGGNGVSYNGFVGGESASVLAGSLSYGGTAQGATNAGTGYTIVPSGLSSSNYTLSYVDGALTINPATVVVTAITGALQGTVSKVYDGTTTATLSAANYALTGWVGSDGASVTKTSGTYDSATAGSGKTVTVSLSNADYTATGSTNFSNYTLPSSISGAVGTISKAPLTVTASNASKTYDGVAYSGGNGVSYSGFVGGESASALSGSLSYGGTSQGATNAGTGYTIKPSGLSSSNYTLNYVEGALTIHPVVVTTTVQHVPVREPEQINPATTSPTNHVLTVQPTPLVAPNPSTSAAPISTSSSGVTVDVRNSGLQVTTMMVAVSVPKGTTTTGTGFTFEMPETVKSMAVANTPVEITQDNGAPIPAWLKFNQSKMQFEATTVPDSALPIQLQVIVAGQRLQVVISERTE